MALWENFPYSNYHDLNLGWIIQQLKKVEEGSVLSVNGQTGEVVLYQADTMFLPEVDTNVWQIIRTCDGVVCGIHFNKDGNATIVNGNRLIEIYTADNPPPYPVESVNGMTGNVTLFEDRAVRLPDLTNDELHNWNIFRKLNNTDEGIQFGDDGTVYIIHGTNRYPIYSVNNPPPYPVTSVDGATGAVTLYPDEDIQFNDITVPTTHKIRLFSMLNNKMIGIEIDDNGSAYILNDESRLPIYVEGVNDPSDFIDPESAILEIVDNLTIGTQWGIVRQLQNDKVGFVVAYDNATDDYKAYMKVNSAMVQLLTLADIPSQTGVVSINQQTGVVTLTGEDITVTSLDSTTIADALGLIKTAMAIVENGDTATHTIIKGEFVIWNDHMYQAIADIAVGDTLSYLNLSLITKGALNNLEDIVDYSNVITWGASNVTGASPVCALEGVGRIRMLRVVFNPTRTLDGWQTVLTLPVGHRPAAYISELVGNTDTEPYVRYMRLTTGGSLQIYGTIQNSLAVNMSYIATN